MDSWPNTTFAIHIALPCNFQWIRWRRMLHSSFVAVVHVCHPLFHHISHSYTHRIFTLLDICIFALNLLIEINFISNPIFFLILVFCYGFYSISFHAQYAKWWARILNEFICCCLFFFFQFISCACVYGFVNALCEEYEKRKSRC